MWKVIAVLLNITSPVCGIQTGIQSCNVLYSGGDVSRATFWRLDECQEYADHIRYEHLAKGENYNTFCASFHDE